MNPLKALRRILPKRKHGTVSLVEGASAHSEMSAKQRRLAEKAWKRGDTSFSYVVHPIRKFIEIKRANYGNIPKLKELLDEARALSQRLKLPLRGTFFGVIRSKGSEPAIAYDIDLRRNRFGVNELNLRDKHTLYADLRIVEETTRLLGLKHAEYTYQTSEVIGNGTLEHVTELDLPQGWKMTKRAEVGSRGGVRKTYQLYKELYL
ncbi:MAG: hypothetical protein AABW72_04565 [archaeon]